MNAAITPTVVDTSGKAAESSSLVTRGEAFLTIRTAEDYEAAAKWLVGARTWTAGVWNHFRESLDAMHRAWKLSREAVAAIADPVESRAEAVDLEMKAFRRRAEDARLAEERRQAEARRQAEREERELAAMMAEEAGDDVQAEAIRTAPPTTAAVHVPVSSYVPAVAGVASRKEWKARITDLRTLAAAVGRGDVGTDCLIGINKHKKLGHLRSKGLDGLAKSFGSLLTSKGWGVEAYEADTTVVSSSGDDD